MQKSNKSIITLVVVGAVALFGILFLLLTAGLTNIEATEVGVKVNKIKKSVDENAVEMGWCLYNRIKSSVFVYRKSAKSFPEEGKEPHTLQLKTKDGQKITVDVSIIYALNKVHVPALHQNVGKTYEIDILLPTLRSEARIVIGSYMAEDIYQGSVRDKIQTETKQSIIDKLTKYPAIEVHEVLLRDFSFEPAFQKKIEDKKLADQEIEVNKRLALAAEEMAKKKEADARGEKLAVIQEAEGEKEKVQLAADAKKYSLEAEAAGQLAIYKAEAEGKRLLNEALTGDGGQNVVALKFAEKIPPSLQIWGIPTGQQNVSLMDLNGIFSGLYKGGGK